MLIDAHLQIETHKIHLMFEFNLFIFIEQLEEIFSKASK